ncbi:PREDICTED: uncharacterized protein LOC102030232 isoform X2 [Chinchilla lanigera]|uniref:uncharacterized protein LOC102030232 isoform X2 n=1 Tax=Chinchilla lanigera TaxID=34839 RepID=UPI0006965C27|nr:PREDICTED: uncharacterized protein LOC102030232 isoform X2 [Chinchilla lanigera]
MEFPCVTQAGLQVLGLSDRPATPSQVAGTLARDSCVYSRENQKPCGWKTRLPDVNSQKSLQSAGRLPRQQEALCTPRPASQPLPCFCGHPGTARQILQAVLLVIMAGCSRHCHLCGHSSCAVLMETSLSEAWGTTCQHLSWPNILQGRVGTGKAGRPGLGLRFCCRRTLLGFRFDQLYSPTPYASCWKPLESSGRSLVKLPQYTEHWTHRKHGESLAHPTRDPQPYLQQDWVVLLSTQPCPLTTRLCSHGGDSLAGASWGLARTSPWPSPVWESPRPHTVSRTPLRPWNPSSISPPFGATKMPLVRHGPYTY